MNSSYNDHYMNSSAMSPSLAVQNQSQIDSQLFTFQVGGQK